MTNNSSYDVNERFCCSTKQGYKQIYVQNSHEGKELTSVEEVAKNYFLSQGYKYGNVLSLNVLFLNSFQNIPIVNRFSIIIAFLCFGNEDCILINFDDKMRCFISIQNIEWYSGPLNLLNLFSIIYLYSWLTLLMLKSTSVYTFQCLFLKSAVIRYTLLCIKIEFSTIRICSSYFVIT